MLSPNNKEWNSMISVQAQINIQTALNLANLSRKIDEINLPKEVLKTTIGKWQEDLIFELCGPLYLHNPKRRYNRAGSTKRTLKTRHGTQIHHTPQIHTTPNPPATYLTNCTTLFNPSKTTFANQLSKIIQNTPTTTHKHPSNLFHMHISTSTH